MFRTDAPPEQETSAELLLFALFALRQLHNLGGNRAAESLGVLLSTKIAGLGAASEVRPYCTAVINSGRSDAGDKQFLGDLEAGDGRALFQMHTKGFGFLGRGVNYYAPESVLVLLGFLASRRSSEDDYLGRLFSIASKCGRLHLAKKISSLNQAQLALGLTLESTPTSNRRPTGKAELNTRTLRSVERLVLEFWELAKAAVDIQIFESANNLEMEALLVQAETKLAAAEGCANAIVSTSPKDVLKSSE